ncbi:superoxide dismutase [Sphingobacterium sp. DK4209]|uniref:Superoxide dismutase n=1 Tax=Sphingobacterium zhuxiongii TaxID=2662364 RepID=A0A5Q0QE52_9SPHI|nr:MULTISPECIES: superoxide dismutase [unclassified Sphingobacterium]MVZ66001.1 superoxide dismutase [Sphingobacterium sp. DK4209]QGA27544.1 superoxide dismutase [Sphingobacterium sp. dk4302]
MAFQLEALPYAADALEPHIDKDTMEIHHDRHHQAYVDNLNKAIAGTDAENASLEDIIKNISKYPAAVRNNGGGHFNHQLFWTVLGPNKGGEPTGELATAINDTFGSFDELKKKLQEAGATRFGSGWSWLIVTADGKLAVTSTPNQDNPLMDVAEVKGTPILGIDVWEHAYYLKYQNKRPAYLDAIFNVINWDAVAERYSAAK